MLSGLAEDDSAWPLVQLSFVRKLVEMSAELVAPLAVKSAESISMSRLATDAVVRASRMPSRAVEVLFARLGMSAGDIEDPNLVEGRVFPSEGGALGDIRSLPDAIHAPYRFALWGAMLLAGDHKMARRMVLDFDWTAFLLVSGVGLGGGTANPGLDWAALGRWLVAAVADAVDEREVSTDDVILL